jgi:hypothetical protein
VKINALLAGGGCGVRATQGAQELQARDLRGWKFATMNNRVAFLIRISFL